MNPILVGFVRNDSSGYEVDFSEKVGNFSFGLLRLAFGKSYEVKVVDGNTSFEEFSHGKAIRVFAFVFMIITSPITIFPGFFVCIGCISSESYEIISKLYQKSASLNPPLAPEKTILREDKPPLISPEFKTQDNIGVANPPLLPLEVEAPPELEQDDHEPRVIPFSDSTAAASSKTLRLPYHRGKVVSEDAKIRVQEIAEDPYFSLPVEVRFKILSQLSIKDLENFAVACKGTAADVAVVKHDVYILDYYDQLLTLINYLSSIDKATIALGFKARERDQDCKIILRRNARWELSTRNLDRIGANKGNKILEDYFKDLAVHFFEYTKNNKTFKDRLFSIQEIDNKTLTPFQKKLIQEIKKLYDQADGAIALIAEQFNEALAVVNHLRSLNSSTLTSVSKIMENYKTLIIKELTSWRLSREQLILIGAEEGEKLFKAYSESVIKCLAAFAKNKRMFKAKLSSLRVIDGHPLTESQKIMVNAIVQGSEASISNFLRFIFKEPFPV